MWTVGAGWTPPRPRRLQSFVALKGMNAEMERMHKNNRKAEAENVAILERLHASEVARRATRRATPAAQPAAHARFGGV